MIWIYFNCFTYLVRIVDITVPIVRIAPKGWAASRKHGLTCLGNGIMGRTPKHRKIVLRGPTKKYGGNAASAAMRGKHPPTTGFAEAAVPSAQKSGAAQRAGWVVLLYLFKISKYRF